MMGTAWEKRRLHGAKYTKLISRKVDDIGASKQIASAVSKQRVASRSRSILISQNPAAPPLEAIASMDPMLSPDYHQDHIMRWADIHGVLSAILYPAEPTALPGLERTPAHYPLVPGRIARQCFLDRC